MYPPLVNHHWYILLPSAVLCFNSHPQANPGVWKKSTYWKWGSPCCISFLVGQVRRCSVHSPCCICFTLSFYQSIFSYSFVFLNINTTAYNRRNITWSHILSVNTNPFLSDKHIWPFLPLATQSAKVPVYTASQLESLKYSLMLRRSSIYDIYSHAKQ